MLYLTPAAEGLIGALGAVTEDQLGAPTPCPNYTLGDLIEHVNGLSLAFTFAANKEQPPGGSAAPSGDAIRLADGWREQIPVQLRALARAWTVPDAWDAMTEVGGITLPGEVAGLVAVNELVVHGWDVSRASGQPFAADPGLVQECIRLAEASADQRPVEGPFGPVVEVPASAPPLDRLIGLCGRDPAWPAG